MKRQGGVNLMRAPVEHPAEEDSNRRQSPISVTGDSGFCPRRLKRVLLPALLAAVAIAGVLIWMSFSFGHLSGFASGNGRLEATEIDIATKLPGRIEAVLVEEGDMVQPGQILARMDTSVLTAQLREAEAEKARAQAEEKVATAVIAERKSALILAERELQRTQQLFAKNVIEAREFDRYQTSKLVAEALVTAAEAEEVSARAAIASFDAKIGRIQADLDDSVLKSSRLGRVQYRLAEPGEVLPAGGKVATLIDISDVYMTFFLPTSEAGKLLIGGDARILLDALPDRAIPATISFVSPAAQFTPKEVETQNEREKLMFRVKARIDPRLLLRYADRVKIGLPGVAYVKLDANVTWPAKLESDLTRKPEKDGK